jgi:hypothetical protein
LKLNTSQTTFEHLHSIAGTPKAGNRTVPKEELMALLMDHSILLAKINELGIKPEVNG